MCKFVILLAAVVACCGLVNGFKNKNQCMRPWGKMNFDQEKFTGDWFVVAKIMSGAIPKMDSTCNKADVSLKHDGNNTRMMYTFVMTVEGHDVKLISQSQPISPRFNSVAQATFKKEGDEHWDGVMMQSILATDYEDFAITYCCQPIFDEETEMFDKKEVLYLMSRKPAMEATLMSVLKNVIGGFDFDVSEMIMVDNTNC